MTVDATDSVPIEAMRVGRRYVTCRPGTERNWTVVATEERLSDVLVQRDGEWQRVPIVTVTYGSGMTLTHERGIDVAVFCDEPGVVD